MAWPVLRSYQSPIEGLGHDAELDDEVAGKVLRLDLAALFPPEAEQGGLVVAHDDAGVGAADEVAAVRLDSANFGKPINPSDMTTLHDTVLIATVSSHM